MGIGLRLARPFTGGPVFATEKPAKLPVGGILAGTIAPDLIDKPLYYGLAWVTGRHGSEIGLISGSRTIGHTALLLLALGVSAVILRSRPIAALVLGMGTHLLLDHVGDSFEAIWMNVRAGTDVFSWGSDRIVGLLWPALGANFPVMPYANSGEHLLSFARPHVWLGELFGAILLWGDWKRRSV